MKKQTKFISVTISCMTVLILVFQFGCQIAQTQAHLPSPLATTATPTPRTYTGNVAVNAPRENDSKQNDGVARHIDFEIKGVGIGTSEAEVIKKLGKPLQIKKSSTDEVCAGEFQKTLRYDGLVFGISSDDEGRNYSVISVDITSSKWMDGSVLKIGTDAEDVETAFDQPNLKETDKGQTIFYYSPRFC